ncbi:MAG: ABC transporter ATP-binding protein [Actinomycetia bacterium]|nr:ABC transporter ATP-binding protein [Actinomycetes bacterium]MCP4958238.1 ABC transporter ATP-binding protein [Actinomycetes bacterium]
MLTMSFSGHIALNALDASIGAGVTGLVGANGAGKTTLFNLILGLIKPSEGHLTVHGLDPTSDGPAVRSTIGFSPEHHILPDEMPADEFVRHMAQVRGLPRSEARGRASDALWLVGLGEERFRPLGTMSTGQRQRVKLAQALASDPSLILLDEPTDGLDPFQRDEMLELIASIRATVGIDVVVSSHLLEEVERICDHVVILDAGRLIAAGPIDEVVGTASPEVFAELAEGDRASLDAQVIASIVEHLSAFDLDVTVEGLTLRMAGDERLALDEFTAAAASSGARVQRLGRRRRRLEDVFVDQGVSS